MIYLLHHSVEHSARQFPEAQAFVCGNRSLSFTELDNQTNQLANLLAAQGVQKGDRVGVYLGRCIETAIAIYGILKAGAAYVPLDPGAPAERINFLLNDCGIQHVVTSPAYSRYLAPVAENAAGLKSVIGLQADWQVPTIPWSAVLEQSAQPLELRVQGNDLAYIMYTSGTTGTPKGIMHTHRSGLAYAKLSAALYELTHTDRIGNHAPLFFDISTLGYFTAPLVGATTVIVSEAHTMMPASLANLLEQERLTVWYSVPLALTQVLQTGALADKDLAALRWVLFGGEPFPPKALRTLMELWPKCQFSNVYGPAEVNQCTYYNLPGPPTSDDPIPLGHVWGNTESLILNGEDQPVAEGETGELLIRTATMMHGYWKQPELTEKGLYKRTGNAGIEEVFYRTGDLASLDTKGLLHFLGRKDRQVKVRGYRVELEEVVYALQKHPQIEEAAVFTVRDDDGAQAIHAVVVPAADAPLTTNEVSRFAAQLLPRYAVPASISLSTALPRTNAGKINHKQLQEAATTEQ